MHPSIIPMTQLETTCWNLLSALLFELTIRSPIYARCWCPLVLPLAPSTSAPMRHSSRPASPTSAPTSRGTRRTRPLREPCLFFLPPSHELSLLGARLLRLALLVLDLREALRGLLGAVGKVAFLLLDGTE